MCESRPAGVVAGLDGEDTGGFDKEPSSCMEVAH